MRSLRQKMPDLGAWVEQAEQSLLLRQADLSNLLYTALNEYGSGTAYEKLVPGGLSAVKDAARTTARVLDPSNDPLSDPIARALNSPTGLIREIVNVLIMFNQVRNQFHRLAMRYFYLMNQLKRRREYVMKYKLSGVSTINGNNIKALKKEIAEIRQRLLELEKYLKKMYPDINYFYDSANEMLLHHLGQWDSLYDDIISDLETALAGVLDSPLTDAEKLRLHQLANPIKIQHVLSNSNLAQVPQGNILQHAGLALETNVLGIVDDRRQEKLQPLPHQVAAILDEIDIESPNLTQLQTELIDMINTLDPNYVPQHREGQPDSEFIQIQALADQRADMRANMEKNKLARQQLHDQQAELLANNNEEGLKAVGRQMKALRVTFEEMQTDLDAVDEENNRLVFGLQLRPQLQGCVRDGLFNLKNEKDVDRLINGMCDIRQNRRRNIRHTLQKVGKLASVLNRFTHRAEQVQKTQLEEQMSFTDRCKALQTKLGVPEPSAPPEKPEVAPQAPYAWEEDSSIPKPSAPPLEDELPKPSAPPEEDLGPKSST